MNSSERSLKVTMQRVQALKHTLSRENLEDHLGDAMKTRYCKRVSDGAGNLVCGGCGVFFLGCLSADFSLVDAAGDFSSPQLDTHRSAKASRSSADQKTLFDDR